MSDFSIASSTDQKRSKIEKKVKKAVDFGHNPEQYEEVLHQAKKTVNIGQLDNLLESLHPPGDESRVISQIMNDGALRKGLRAVDREIKRVERIKQIVDKLILDNFFSFDEFVKHFQRDQDNVAIGDGSLEDLLKRIHGEDQDEDGNRSDEGWKEMIKSYHTVCNDYCRAINGMDDQTMRDQFRKSGLAPTQEEFRALLSKEERRCRKLSEPNEAPLISSEAAAQAWQDSRDHNGDIANPVFKEYYPNIARHLAKTQKLLQGIVTYSTDYMGEDSQTIKEIKLDLAVIEKYMIFFDNLNPESNGRHHREYNDRDLFDLAAFRFTKNNQDICRRYPRIANSYNYSVLKQLDQELRARVPSWQKTTKGEFRALQQLLNQAKQKADEWLEKQEIVPRRSDGESSSSEPEDESIALD